MTAKPQTIPRSLTTLALLCAVLLAGGCVLLSKDSFQTLVLFFELSEDVPEGETLLVHTAVYPHEVKLKKQFVRISGKLNPSPAQFAERSGGARMATNVEVEAVGVVVDEATGNEKRDHKFANKVKIAADGSFEAVKRFKTNIAADVIQTITVKSLGGALPAGTQVALCVDVAANKKDFTAGNSCATPADGGGGGDDPDAQTHVIQVIDNAFQPQRLTIQPGDKVRWELSGNDLTHTVTALDGSFNSGFVFNATGASFERSFPASADGQTFEYFCQTHRTCCQMQGSVSVGANASPPMDGY